MLAVGVIYTPQAAGTAALIVPVEKRGSTIAYIFLGWSLAAAVGLPLITFIASRYGWQAVYGSIGAMGFLSSLLLAWRLPGGLRAAPVELKTWVDLGRNRAINPVAGDHGAADLRPVHRLPLHGAAAQEADGRGSECDRSHLCAVRDRRLCRHSDRDPHRRLLALLFNALVMIGITGWALSAGLYVLMAAAVAVWGLGFASTNSMQQVRLVAAAPPLAPASVALNTSVLYIGQAIGSFVGGLFYARELLYGVGFVGMAFVMLAVMLVLASQPRPAPAS